MLGAYPSPKGWEVLTGPRTALSGMYNEVYPKHLDWYGIFADDVVPRTRGWDKLLIEAASSDGISYGDDGISDKPTHFVVGGNLAREVGWLALPGLKRTYIDMVWYDIAVARGVLRYLPDVKIPHLHFSNRKALMDKTYRKPDKAHDRAVYEKWRTDVY